VRNGPPRLLTGCLPSRVASCRRRQWRWVSGASNSRSASRNSSGWTGSLGVRFPEAGQIGIALHEHNPAIEVERENVEFYGQAVCLVEGDASPHSAAAPTLVPAIPTEVSVDGLPEGPSNHEDNRLSPAGAASRTSKCEKLWTLPACQGARRPGTAGPAYAGSVTTIFRSTRKSGSATGAIEHDGRSGLLLRPSSLID
jgi:hypothetical protein